MEENYDLHILKMRHGFFYNYTYLGIDKTSGAAFTVDPAWELEKIMGVLNKSGAELKAILLTHSHFDHVHLVQQLVKIFNSDVYISQQEIDYYGFSSKNLKSVNDKEEIHVGSTNISCLLTPGHTKGGMCYLSDKNLFTGDTVFIEGCGLCDSFGGSPEQMYYSIQKIKNTLPLDVLVFPGHSYGKAPGKSLEYLLQENIYFLLDTKEHFVDFRMKKGKRGLFDFK